MKPAPKSLLLIVALVSMALAAPAALADAPAFEILKAAELELNKLHNDTTLKVVATSSNLKSVAWIEKSGNKDQVIINGKAESEFEWVVPKSLVFSPDGTRLAYIMQTNMSSAIVVDGKPGPACDQIVDEKALFSPDSKRIAYVAVRGGKSQVVVHNEWTGDSWDAIQYANFCQNSQHTIACVRTGSKLLVLRDNDIVTKKGYEQIFQFPTVSPDGMRIGLLAIIDEKVVPVIDDKPLQPYDFASTLIFSPDSSRTAFLAAAKGKDKEPNKGWAVIDGKDETHYDQIAAHTLRFSSDSKHYAYAAKKGTKFVMVKDGQEIATYDQLMDVPVFSEDGNHLAFRIAKDGKHSIWYDGQEQPTAAAIASIMFSPDSKQLAYAALKDNQWTVIRTNNAETRVDPYAGMGGILAWSPDSAHLGYCGSDGRSWYLVVDGQKAQETYNGFTVQQVVFDDANTLHTIGVRNDKLVLVSLTLKAK